MADYPGASSPGRSANMRAIRRTGTKPELALRSALHRQGYRFRKDFRLDLSGGARVRPDIAFTARRVAVFVDGCFWHVCPEHGRDPRVNEWYWAPKLRRNMERDRAADAALLAAGWRVVRIWEHESLDAAVAAVVAALGGPAAPAPAAPAPAAPAPAGPGEGTAAAAAGPHDSTAPAPDVLGGETPLPAAADGGTLPATGRPGGPSGSAGPRPRGAGAG